VKPFVLAALAGALFAIGLVVSGMTVPAKITAFLDVRGAWDPALAFVMVGAIAVYAPLHAILRRRTAPVLADRFYEPVPRRIDARLVGGAALFGIGWGVSGYCPGPALVSLGSGAGAVVFVVMMIGGAALARRFAPR
jgi:uncharacterized protein